MDVETLRKVAQAIMDSGLSRDEFREIMDVIDGECPSSFDLDDIGKCDDIDLEDCFANCWLQALGLKEAE